ncbi:MAG: Putative isomerase YbhH [Candidatus Celerinatantimonas neptuna]|nr:MAG: Putative isomerase YbhH [Candidatus Celerinatantimonas neptuna]
MKQIPCLLMRGGTSKGPVILASDLPEETRQRDDVLLNLMGSGHELEIDGLGGGYAQSSKVAIISPSTSPDADIDYLFAQVMVEERRVDTTPNCGNMLCAVGPAAIERGLICPQNTMTPIRIRNVNTNTFIDVEIQTENGQVIYDGETHIDGVPGTAAPISVTFLNAAGCKTGKLLPTDHAIDQINGVDVTCIDMAMPMVLIHANDLDKQGDEKPEDLDKDIAFLERLEAIRLKAGQLMGFGDVSEMVIPKPVLVSAPEKDGSIQVRYFMPHKCHKSLAITGSIGISTACVIPGSVAFKVVQLNQTNQFIKTVKIEHPSGSIQVVLNQPDDQPEHIKASVIRTARKLFTGQAYVPENTVNQKQKVKQNTTA